MQFLLLRIKSIKLHIVFCDMSIQSGCKTYNRILHVVIALNVCEYLYNTIIFPNIKISTENARFINIHNHFFKITENNNQIFFLLSLLYYVSQLILYPYRLKKYHVLIFKTDIHCILSRFFYMQKGCND